MPLLSIQGSQAIILGFAAIIILVCVIAGIKKFGIKSILWWIGIGILAYLFFSDAVFG